jgi:uncharacterized Zn-binding protein involved in type VI secretion
MENIMLRAVICKGDRTSHGGTVIEGDETCTTGGRAIAKRNHMTFCPQCKGNFPIAEGLDFFTFTGLGTVLEGMKTACGAQLIASQHEMRLDDRTGGEGSAATSGATSNASATGSTSASAVAPSNVATTDFRGAFCVIDEDSGQPCPDIQYRIELSDGRVLRGVTNAQGETEYLSAGDRATAKLYWGTEQAHGSIAS